MTKGSDGTFGPRDDWEKELDWRYGDFHEAMPTVQDQTSWDWVRFGQPLTRARHFGIVQRLRSNPWIGIEH